MSDKRYLGNIITPTPTAPAGPYQDDAAKGVWSLQEAYTYIKAGTWPTANNLRPIAVFAGSYNGSFSNVIQQIQIATAGNSTDFGDLSTVRTMVSAASSSTRGIFAGGTSDLSNATNTIEYITIVTAGNATDFGDLLAIAAYGSGCGDSTRAVFAHGNSSGSFSSYLATNVLSYITIASAGNSTDFGDIATTNRHSTSACSSSTRGVFSSGSTAAPNLPSATNVIDYVTIASAGNTTDFGDLSVFVAATASCSSSTRGLIAGGWRRVAGVNTYENTIGYITIASAGNATDFGDLTLARYYIAGASSSTRGVFGGGYTGSAYSNVIDYVTIDSAGNAIDFGDLLSTGYGVAACSNTHGGLS
jgi:hypothetical protein